MTSKLKTSAAAYTLSAIAYGAIYAYPVSEGGAGNIASFVAWTAVACVAILLTLALFTRLDSYKFNRNPRPGKWLLRIASYGAVVWLAYHGAFVMASIMAYNVIMSALFRAAVKAHEEAA